MSKNERITSAIRAIHEARKHSNKVLRRTINSERYGEHESGSAQGSDNSLDQDGVQSASLDDVAERARETREALQEDSNRNLDIVYDLAGLLPYAWGAGEGSARCFDKGRALISKALDAFAGSRGWIKDDGERKAKLFERIEVRNEKGGFETRNMNRKERIEERKRFRTYGFDRAPSYHRSGGVTALSLFRAVGDEGLEWLVTFVLLVWWLLARLLNQYYEEPRWVVVARAGLMLGMTANQFKRLPFYAITKRAAEGSPVNLKRLLFAASVASTVSGSLVSMNPDRWVYVASVVSFRYVPDLLAGAFVSGNKIIPEGRLAVSGLRLGPVGGGAISNGDDEYDLSGLSLLASRPISDDDRVYKRVGNENLEKRVGDIIVPHHIQEMSLGNVTTVEGTVPAYKLETLEGVDTDGWEVEDCAFGGSEQIELQMSAKSHTGTKILHRVGYTKKLDDGTLKSNVSQTYSLTPGYAKVKMMRGDFYTKIIKAFDFEPTNVVLSLGRYKKGEHDMCEAFLNAATYSRRPGSDVKDELLVDRIAVAWLVRTASRETNTGFQPVIKFRTEDVRGGDATARFATPDWLLWTACGVFGLLTAIYIPIVFSDVVVKRGFTSMVSNLGDVVKRKTTRCATRDLQMWHNIEGGVADCDVIFGIVLDEAGLPITGEIFNRTTRMDEIAVHLGWETSDRILAEGLPSRMVADKIPVAGAGGTLVGANRCSPGQRESSCRRRRPFGGAGVALLNDRDSNPGIIDTLATTGKDERVIEIVGSSQNRGRSCTGAIEQRGDLEIGVHPGINMFDSSTKQSREMDEQDDIAAPTNAALLGVIQVGACWTKPRQSINEGSGEESDAENDDNASN